MLEASALSCVKEGRSLFTQLSFQILPGQICHVVGANGIGKTSLLRIVAGLSQPSTGELFWEQQTISKQSELYFRDSLYLGHQAGLRAELTALENLRFYGQVAGSSIASDDDIYLTLAKVGLAGFEDLPVNHLSAGQQRRVSLARLWLEPCKLWILDEPFTAIDVQGIAYLEQVLLEHAVGGGMVLMTSHQALSMAKTDFQLIDLADYQSEAAL